jgi:hypothetical protein
MKGRSPWSHEKKPPFALTGFGLEVDLVASLA